MHRSHPNPSPVSSKYLAYKKFLRDQEELKLNLKNIHSLIDQSAPTPRPHITERTRTRQLRDDELERIQSENDRLRSRMIKNGAFTDNHNNYLSRSLNGRKRYRDETQHRYVMDRLRKQIHHAQSDLSTSSYLTYLDDYVQILCKCTDQSLIEKLNENYVDEIQKQTRFILIQWHNEHFIDQSSSLFIERVGHLNRKMALLTERCQLNEKQMRRIEQLLCNSEMTQLIVSILESILESTHRHHDPFLRHLAILIDSFSLMQSQKTIFNDISERVLRSDYYQQYLTELLTSEVQQIHLFFVGAMSQLANQIENATLNELYSQFLIEFFHGKPIPNNPDLHYCTLGILSQLNLTSLINDYPCISALVSFFLGISVKSTADTMKVFRLPLLKIFNALCIQSKIIACYLNNNDLIDILLHHVTNRNQHCQIHIYACLLLGHIISDNQLIQYRISHKLLMKLLDILFSSKNHIENVLFSLLSLTIHEQIQFLIAQTYQLRNLIQLTEQHSTAYEIIWKLSFHSDIIEQLTKRHENFLEHLSTLADHPAAQGILENIQTKNIPHLPNTNAMPFDYALVSSPKDAHLIRSIEDQLRKHNIQAGTVDNSRCIILCISEESKHDCTCQATIRKALIDCKKILPCIFQKPYRIDDWFETLNLSERKFFNLIESGAQKLLPEIQKDSQQLSTIVKRTRILSPPLKRNSQATFTLSPPPQQPSPVEVPPKVQGKKIQTWTNREVLQWCEKNQLNGFNKILARYDGRSLLTLAHIARMNAPHTIINHLRNDCRKHGLRLPYVEFVRFQAALDELLRLEQTLLRRQSVSLLASRYVYKGRATQKA
ncbi:unnamed protein product [Adineta ricciae]|uniref:Uncharacterized protein n=1 Tax=Adineta ricciae TaxID=249248 RepID=A0A814RKM2_ADIRI|nr:unnamed protein product [Adineta ricciae]